MKIRYEQLKTMKPLTDEQMYGSIMLATEFQKASFAVTLTAYLYGAHNLGVTSAEMVREAYTYSIMMCGIDVPGLGE